MTSYDLYSIRYTYRFFTCQKTEPKTDSLYRCARLTAYWCTRLVTVLQSNMIGTELTDVMRIKLLSPLISEFEPTDAIHAWNATAIAHADQIIKRLAVQLVMHQTKSHMVAVATMKIVPKQCSDS